MTTSKMMMIRVKLAIIIARLLIWLSTLSPSCLGFPGLLVERPSGCMVDLSTDEVIMNNQVVAYAETSHPNVKLVVLQNNDWIPGPVHVDASLLPTTVTIRLDVQTLRDVQYALEATEGGTFTSGAIGCDGRRASARSFEDPGVELTIENLPVKVWAGWATGHEAVQLTDYLVFEEDSSETNQKKDPAVVDAKEAAAAAALLAEEQRKQIQQQSEKTDTNGKESKVDEQPKKSNAKKTKAAKSRSTQSDQEEEHHHFALPKSGMVSSDEEAHTKKKEIHKRNNNHAKKETTKRHWTPPREYVYKKQRHNDEIAMEDEESSRKQRKNKQSHGPLHGYEKESYTPEFNMMQFMYGAVFFVGTMFAILLLLESSSGARNKRKGHRDL